MMHDSIQLVPDKKDCCACGACMNICPKNAIGMKEDELRSVSHHPKTYIGVGHVPPDFHMGEICIELNLLRAKSRELEIAGVQASYTKNRAERNDILTALNQLSSAIYILYCRYLSKRNWGQL